MMLRSAKPTTATATLDVVMMPSAGCSKTWAAMASAAALNSTPRATSPSSRE